MRGSLVGRLVIVPLLVMAISCESGTGTSPSSAPPAQVVRFRVDANFMAFAWSEGVLVYSGGPTTKGAPDIYARDVARGNERAVIVGERRDATILTLAASQGRIVYTETFPTGPVVYRVRLTDGTHAETLAELLTPEGESQEIYRAIPLPMVAIDGDLVAWTEPRFGAARQLTYRLSARALSSGRTTLLKESDRALMYPHINDGRIVFHEGFDRGTVWLADTRASSLRQLSMNSLSEPAIYGQMVVAKRGGRNALDPAAIVLIDLGANSETEIAPASDLAWEPSLNRHYAVWGSSPLRLDAYDLLARRAVVLAGGAGANEFIGRPAAFPGAVVWLSEPARDLTSSPPVIPYFNVLRE